MTWKKHLADALADVERLVVLGVGNTDRADDAAGVHAAEVLAKRVGDGLPNLSVLLGHGVPENFTGKIREFRPSHVLIIDAAAGGFRPGTRHIVDPHQIAQDDVSTHRTPLSTLAEFLERTIGCRVVILGIEPERLTPGDALTPRVKTAAARAADHLAGFCLRRFRSSSASRRKYS